MNHRTLIVWILMPAVGLSIFIIGYFLGEKNAESFTSSPSSRFEQLLENIMSSPNERKISFSLQDLSTEVGGEVYMAHWLEMYLSSSTSWEPMALVIGYVDDKTQCEEWADWMRDKYTAREYRCVPWTRHSNSY